MSVALADAEPNPDLVRVGEGVAEKVMAEEREVEAEAVPVGVAVADRAAERDTFPD